MWTYILAKSAAGVALSVLCGTRSCVPCMPAPMLLRAQVQIRVGIRLRMDVSQETWAPHANEALSYMPPSLGLSVLILDMSRLAVTQPRAH